MLTDENFMNIAFEFTRASKCVSKQVGALIVKDGRIISTGYNGTPAGYINCNEHWNNELIRDKHHIWAQKYEIHAEMNAILYAAKTGMNVDGATVYCSLEPCGECSKNLIQAGIKRIVYEVSYEYSDTEEINAFLKAVGVEKVQLAR